MKPLITVVTVCFNSKKTISRTIESVLVQKVENFEYLIIDGGSTDGTIDIIRSYEDRFLGKLKWISEQDNGWYDAMNKGIRLSEGLFIVFLNSDDYFDKEVLQMVGDYIEKNEITDKEIVYGDSTNIYQNAKGKQILKLVKAPDYISLKTNGIKTGMCGIRHQSMFTGRQVFNVIGELNLKYRLHADWDFLIKCVKNNVTMHHIEKNLSFYSMYGASTRPNYKERHMLRKDNNLYKLIDFNYYFDRFGIKTVLKIVLGEDKWNDLLFLIHEVGGI